MSTYIKNKYIALIIFTISFIFPNQFGKNIVQYNEFEWYYAQSNHFDIYVSDSTGYHIDFVEEHIEDAYNKIKSLLNWSLKDRISIIIYSSHNEFQQTNVISSHLPEGVGGVTELLKNRVVIPFDGSHREFKHVIYHELLHVFINDCVYGGNLKSMMANSIEVRIPLWMNEGLAEYISDSDNVKESLMGWNSSLDTKSQIKLFFDKLSLSNSLRRSSLLWISDIPDNPKPKAEISDISILAFFANFFTKSIMVLTPFSL